MKNEEQAQQPTRRILCIDGGGILGTFPAAFLASLEQHLQGRPIGSYFDLIAGTSTGGIIAIGLAMGLRASELLDLYEQRGPEIFGQGRGPVADSVFSKLRLGRWLIMNKHDAAPLRAVLEDVLGSKRIGDAKTRLLIPAWNPVARSVYIYKTAHHARLRNDYKSLAVDAALATAAAPTRRASWCLISTPKTSVHVSSATGPLGRARATSLRSLRTSRRMTSSSLRST